MRMRLWMVVLAALTVGCDEHSRDPDRDESLGGKVPDQEPPWAVPVPGKAGFVFSPYNNQVVDVRSIPPGTVVVDPTSPDSERKLFRVPEPAAQAPGEKPVHEGPSM